MPGPRRRSSIASKGFPKIKSFGEVIGNKGIKGIGRNRKHPILGAFLVSTCDTDSTTECSSNNLRFADPRVSAFCKEVSRLPSTKKRG